jgi:hypothetical protein
MPVMHCTIDGKPGYKFGSSGHCYTYTKGDDAGKEKAREKAAAKGRAVKSSKSQ